MMSRSEQVASVSSALKNGILPSYLKNLFWEAAGKNPFIYLLHQGTYMAAVYQLASLCYFFCLEIVAAGKERFKAGFPGTIEELKEKVHLGLVQIAAEKIALERLGQFWSVSDAEAHFRTAF